MRVLPWIVVLLLVSSGPAVAAVTVAADLDRSTARVGEQVELTISVEGQTQGLREPNLPDFGPFQVYRRGSSQQVSWVNGQMSANHTFNYALVPRREGTFTLPSVEIAVGDAVFRSVELELTVVAAEAPIPTPEPTRRSDGPTPDGDFFVTMTVDRDSVVVGEQIVLTFAFHRATRASLFENPEYTPPSTEGFWREDLPPERRYDRVIQSRRWAVTEIRYALFPTQAGNLTIGEAVVRIPDDMFQSLFRRRQGRRNRGDEFLRAPAIPIHVRPLPPGAPPEFTGTVGESLEFTAEVDRDEVAAGDAITLTMTLSGGGYLPAAKRPEIQDLDGFRIHDAGSGVDSRPLGNGLVGRLEIQKLLIPTEPGEVTVPEQRYAYYDTDRRRYVTLRAPAIPLRVTPSDSPGSAVFAGGNRSEIELLGSDILHVKPVPANLGAGGPPLPTTAAFWGMLALPGVAWLASGLLARRRRAARSDPAAVRRRRALRTARERLEAAGDAAERASEALYGFIGDKSGRGAAGLTARFVEEWLRGEGVEADLVARTRGVLERCDQSRFAGTAGGDASLEAETRSVLDALEGALR